MLEHLTNNLGKIFDRLSGKKFIGEGDLDQTLREIRIALLEADVSLPIAKQFIEQVRAEALGREVIKSVSPSQMIVKIIHDQLVELLGSEKPELMLKPKSVIMLVGLQGAGKTTTAGKLARWLNLKQQKRVMLASLDVARPAAAAQLELLAKKTQSSFAEFDQSLTPVALAKRALATFNQGGDEVLILDTAGRTHINEELMEEVASIERATNPIEILLVVDALTGQDAINIANNFKQRLKLTGVILTRLDANARFGVALTMRAATNCPIKLTGVGEKLEELEEFVPERIASKIIGMGDVVSLVEKAQEVLDIEEGQKSLDNLRSGKFDFNELLKQIKNMKKMGGVTKLMKFLPSGLVGNAIKKVDSLEGEMTKQEAIILSMTKLERSKPEILNFSRKKRIAAGAGYGDVTGIQEINRLLKRYKQMQKMVKKVGKLDPSSIQQMMQQKGLN